LDFLQTFDIPGLQRLAVLLLKVLEPLLNVRAHCRILLPPGQRIAATLTVNMDHPGPVLTSTRNDARNVGEETDMQQHEASGQSNPARLSGRATEPMPPLQRWPNSTIGSGSAPPTLA
jgi:hypothetical protein